jgi:hypothetical protein
VHDYCWKPNYCYPDAPTDKTAEVHAKNGFNYDIIHFGDNHKGFLNPPIFNGGTFYRRAIDEVDYRPMVGLVCDDNTVKPAYVPIEKDIITLKVQDNKNTENEEIGNFVEYLSNVSLSALDIEEVIKQYTIINGVPDAVTTEIARLLEQTRHG